MDLDNEITKHCCGFGSNIKQKFKKPDHERIVLHKVKLNTYFSGTCEIYLEKDIYSLNSPRSPMIVKSLPREDSYYNSHPNVVSLRSFNNGCTIKVIDVQENNIDSNILFPLNSLNMLNIKSVDLDNTYYENDIIVHCYEYIDFLKSYNIKFPYSELYVLSNVLDLENAYWNGSYLTFGAGIKGHSKAFVSSAIIGHELTHGLIQASNNLDYYGESGALNEAYADIFGVVFEFALREKLHKLEYELGSELFDDNHPLRSFAEPNKCGQPENIRDKLFYKGYEDNGGVHINSGVINHLFYKMQLIRGRKKIFEYFLKVFFKLRHNSLFSDFKGLLLCVVMDDSELINIIYQIL